MSAYAHQGHVYFAACGQYVKIGYTAQADVQERLKHLLTGRLRRPADIDLADSVWLMHTIPGCVMRDERRIHGLFAPHHVMGEWFRMSPAFIEQLASLRYVTYAETLREFRRVRRAIRRSPSLARAG